jgi:hypothetical protein
MWRKFLITGLLGLGATGMSAESLQFAPVASIDVPADMIKVQGRYAYVAGAKTITILDLSSPNAPKRLGSYQFPDKIWGIRVVGSLVYVADDLTGLGILDVSNPAAPVLRGSFKTKGQAKAVVVLGNKAVVVDHMQGLDVFDVSDVSKPVFLSSLFVDGYARDIALSGSIAYAVDSPSGFYVLDLSKPGPLDFASSLQSANGQVITVSDPEKGQGPKLACVPGRGGLQVFDVSDPAAPALASTFRTPSGAPARAVLRGTRAYVADGREGLQVVDLSNPVKPNIIGAYNTTGPARDVAVNGGLVLVVVGTGQVQILRETG